MIQEVLLLSIQIGKVIDTLLSESNLHEQNNLLKEIDSMKKRIKKIEKSIEKSLDI